MKTTALARIAAGLLVLVLAPLASVQAKEDPSRCPCWYDGYDEYKSQEGKASCTNPPPISGANECDRDQKQKQLWTDGCLAHSENEERKCPYKSAGN